uniref:Gamma carbonic anhydrase n=1 Tax=Pyramimonas obovata TaxID=1411642 RepID=A0A7S0RDI2_9CHLO|mmetsp:Transcript_31385/g.68609  ORF Transcript_31385/g.68609 Transcript_31385/m.68609 type:complete len:237 (+) Transcript_31385:58-768(+)
MAFLQRASRTGFSLVSRAVRPASARFYSANPIVDEDLYNRQRSTIELGPRVPHIAGDAFIAPSAVVVGDVDIFDGVSIMYGAVVRGDLNNIKVGAFSNIQDKAVVHAARSSPTGLSAATTIGSFVTVGAGSILRSCAVQDNVKIGKKCIVMEGAVVEKNAILVDGTVVPPGRMIPAGQMWSGNPATYVRDCTEEEVEDIAVVAEQASELRKAHATEFLPYSTAYIDAEKLRAWQKS